MFIQDGYLLKLSHLKLVKIVLFSFLQIPSRQRSDQKHVFVHYLLFEKVEQGVFYILDINLYRNYKKLLDPDKKTEQLHRNSVFIYCTLTDYFWVKMIITIKHPVKHQKIRTNLIFISYHDIYNFKRIPWTVILFFFCCLIISLS